jgi:hypothetical protein
MFDGSSWVRQAQLAPSDSANYDRFGISVAISGTTIVVGAAGKNLNEGAAYVFTFDGSSWVQQAVLTANDGVPGTLLGTSVAIDGRNVVVGAEGDGAYAPPPSPGAAYVFAFDGSSWAQQTKLGASDGAPKDGFGAAGTVASSGGTVIVGGTATIGGGSSPQGAAYVFAPPRPTPALPVPAGAVLFGLLGLAGALAIGKRPSSRAA